MRSIVASNRFVGGIEQVTSSATSMLGLIVLSRLMPIDAFGVLSGAVGIWLIMEMVQHAVTISPFVISCPEPRETPSAFGAWLWFNIALSLLICLSFVLAGSLLLPLVPLLGSSLMLAGPLTLAGMSYMFTRRVQYHLGQRLTLIGQVSLYGASYLAAMGVVVFSGVSITAAVGAAILCTAYGLPALLFTLLLLRHARLDGEALAHIVKARGLITRLSAAGMIWQLSYTAVLLTLAIWATPAAVAVYAVARTLIRPVTLLISTVSDVDFSRASRAYTAGGITELRLVVASSGRILLILTAPIIVALLVFPGFLLHLVYGERYAGATLELQMWTLLFIPLVYVAVLDIGLTVLRDIGFLIRAHAIGLACSVVLLAACTALGQLSTATALACLVAARSISVPILHLRYRQLTAAPASHAPLVKANANAQ